MHGVSWQAQLEVCCQVVVAWCLCEFDSLDITDSMWLHDSTGGVERGVCWWCLVDLSVMMLFFTAPRFVV